MVGAKVAELGRHHTWRLMAKSDSITISQLMHALGRAVHDLQHLRIGLMSDKEHLPLSRALSTTRSLLLCCKSHTALCSHIITWC